MTISGRRFSRVACAALLVLAVRPGGAETPQAPTDPYLPKPTGLADADLAALKAGAETFAGQIAVLKTKHANGPMRDRIADVEVYWAGVHNQIDQNLRTDLARAQRALQAGTERATQLAQGHTPWMTQNGVRGFYSKIDGSVQPYILNVPVNFNASDPRTYRLDLFLHGRGDGEFELNFMFGKSTTSFTNMPLNPGPDRFILQPYGRYSNASRFAGETDVLEAIDSVKKAYAIDDNRVVLTGFSMGGASAWQFAVHYADRWAASSAGAGFTETAAYLKLAAAMPPQYQQALWHMYDSKDYAINTFNSPTVAYSGEIDPQKQSADVMDAAMAEEGLTLERMIGPNTGHSYEPATRLRLIARLDDLAAKGRDPAPKEIRFTTWTLRYHTMYWLDVDGLEHHWERARVNARVDGDSVAMTTANVSALHLNWEPGLAPFAPGVRPRLTIDGTAIVLPAVAASKSLNVGLVKSAGLWKIGEVPANALHKTPGLQGPIDDAFMDSFMIVRPTGEALNKALGTWENEQLNYAVAQWQNVFRGDPRLKNDTEITADDIAAHNLVLFGDPASNAIYRKIASRLPITWTKDGVVVGDRHFSADVHAPVLIFPNPLNPKKYVVINSGFTFHDPSSNARQSPKLPDWAVVDMTEPGTKALPLSVKAQGFFDESWKLK
jgi:pimeloyl-ACP methyl ester carboxylesterase